MGLFVRNILSADQLVNDVRMLIPDAGVRRRMSRIIKTAVSTGVECAGGLENIGKMDAIITATGYGCLADSERFLRNVINDREELLNPTPFIQSTFNTVGGQIALLRHNHCYNMTYVNRSHSFEDALLDAWMQAADGDASEILLGAFDERTDSQCGIMGRMGLWRRQMCGEGCVFMWLEAERTEDSIAEVAGVWFPDSAVREEDLREMYGCADSSVVLYNACKCREAYPTVSASIFAEGVDMIRDGASEVLIYNEMWGASPAVVVLKCIG